MNPIKKLCFLLPYFIVAACFYIVQMGGVYTYIGPILVLIVFPILDLIIGADPANPTDDEVNDLRDSKYYRYLVIAFVPVMYLALGYGAYLIIVRDYQLYEIFGIMSTIGMAGGVFGITLAHELGHKNDKTERFLAQVLLNMVCYGHFYIEHNQGHHVNVSTKDDPASARRNESFYRFYFRTVIGSYLSAWNLEKKRLKKKKLEVISRHNKMLWYIFWPVVISFGVGSLGYLFGNGFSWVSFAYFYVQSIIAFSLLELINYIEHYGLSRKEVKPGRYEKVTHLHSWNSNMFMTNVVLFHLQRHSDHHANANRRYQNLIHHEDSPQLPTGYAGMLLIGLVPPVWFRVMNRRLDDFYQAKSAA